MNRKTLDSLVFTGQTGFYKGKVRNVHIIDHKYLVLIASDRISAFDIVLPANIPYKGQILNRISAYMLEATKDLVPNWLISVPHPNVSVGYYCTPFPVEMVVRGYLAGHAAREYKSGKRMLCGVPLPDGMKENQAFPSPIITPTTKEQNGAHDEDISKEEIISRGLVSEEDYEKLEDYALKLFAKGTEMAAEKGLILVDTKYEFGKDQDGNIRLIDEIHTPDSSRYFYRDSYRQLLEQSLPQRQLSKEFVREWLMENGFQGKSGQQIPEMTNKKIDEISQRYIELYETITGEKFSPGIPDSSPDAIYRTVTEALRRLS